MKIGIIGSGNIANAIMSGSIKSGKFSPENFWVFDVFGEKAEQCKKKYGVNIAPDATYLAANMDVVVLAVKPKDFPSLLSGIDNELKANNPLIVSMAAGLYIEYIESLISCKAAVARLMTNINATIGEAMTAYCLNANVSAEQEKFVDTFCNSIGDGLKLDESYFALFGVIAGCGPAFAYMFVDEFARAGVKIGLNKQLSLRIAAQTVVGSAKLIAESDVHPYELIDRVCTPGGTTIEGIGALQQCGLAAAITKAVESSYEKDVKLSKAHKN